MGLRRIRLGSKILWHRSGMGHPWFKVITKTSEGLSFGTTIATDLIIKYSIYSSASGRDEICFLF